MTPGDVEELREGFRSTSAGGLDRESVPMRLWEKGKRLGTWNPADVDLERDAEQWGRLADDERDLLLRLSALFQAGEEAVTVDLLPLIRVIADEGRLEEEMYLASFLWEEAKHVDAFRRFFEEVAHHDGDLSAYHTPAYRRLFHRELPAAMRRLEADPSPRAQAEASVVYHMIVEGVLAETGYHAYREMLEREDLLPGTRSMLTRVQRDESRHLAYGVWLLSRLVAEHGEPVWEAVEGRMGELLEVAITLIHELFDCYEPMPFGLELDAFVGYAMDQFSRRMDRIERARGESLEAVRRSMGG
mgnify:CR=1 FL=1